MSKKGATKASRQAASYEPRDIVLGKVRGFPPWPGMVVDPDSVPSQVSSERPRKAATTMYCVRFFPMGDYSWLVEKDISKLQPHEITSYISEPSKKSADLLAGYRIAQDPTKWLAERDAMASKAAEAEENAEVDQLDDESGETASAATKPKKRKRESDVTSAVKAKKAQKAKKEPAEGSKKKAASASAKGRKGSKSKAMLESEDEGDHEGGEDSQEDAGPSKNASPPPPKKAKRDKEDDVEDGKANDPEALKVRDWRHKLQKSLLNTKITPKHEDMPGLDELFKTVEQYDSMTIDQLQFSKIGKVMRHIAVLSEDKVPRDDEFKFRERSNLLVQKWQRILNANKTNGSENGNTNANGSPGKPEDTQAQSVTDGTAALDLNGTSKEPKATTNGGDTADALADGEADAPGETGDSSILADVTMSEAAA